MPLRPLLRYIAEHLFDPDLRVDRMYRACGVRDKSISVAFRSCVGMTPAKYVRDCRMEVAKSLLEETSMQISQMSEILGYSNLKTFSHAFLGWMGIRPSQYRASVQGEADGTAPDVEMEWQRALRRTVRTPEEARAAVHYLRQRFALDEDGF